VAESVKQWDLRKVTEMTGVPPESIEKAARWIGKSKRAIMLHARGLEHQSKGVENCLAVINIALATGNVGREGAGPTMITGQGNGQGGREHRSATNFQGSALSPIRRLASILPASGAFSPKSFPSRATARKRL
jgi:anaerobic selenocysteine-containing dehydrogenase